jgi:uncharacterized protein
MNIGIIGATGNIGQRTLAEALRRGHHATAFTRATSNIPEDRGSVTWKIIDVLDPGSVAGAIGGIDVLISLYQPGNASKNFDDTVRQSIADPNTYAVAARSLLAAMENHPSLRLLVVGGAGSLERRPGVTEIDSPSLGSSLRELGLPEAYAVAVRGHRDALNVYRLSNRLWTYLSPAEHIYPGERTGRFRLGGDQLIVDADGKSRISLEDCAVALIDEAELPRHIQRRFTIGY